VGGDARDAREGREVRWEVAVVLGWIEDELG
jgi:hypothetical protein